ncbi:MAG: dTDP-4-dehydrorhamnose 3,5-epimerase family protein [Candidatus Nitrotoga sp.]|nr:dTDP-4-dehydrorhamnose 3,5-epimerase family protein [Candidatus Nitrotoga sp.]
MADAARGRHYLCAGTQSAPEFERSIAWNDHAIGIQWPIQGEPTLYTKDQQAKPLAEAEHFA